MFRNPINSGANAGLSGQYSASAAPHNEGESGGTSTRDVLDILIKQVGNWLLPRFDASRSTNTKLQTREALRNKIVIENEDGDGDDVGGDGDDGNEDGGGRVKKVVLPVTYDITALQL